MSALLEPIEDHLRAGELIDGDSQLLIRGWPLSVEGLKRNAEQTSQRYSWRGAPLVAVSAELTMPGWSLETILSGRRLRSRSRYAEVRAGQVLEAGFTLLATFDAPHYSIIWASYTDAQAELLSQAFGPAVGNPHHLRRPR